jgi:hypothetical protein
LLLVFLLLLLALRLLLLWWQLRLPERRPVLVLGVNACLSLDKYENGGRCWSEVNEQTKITMGDTDFVQSIVSITRTNRADRKTDHSKASFCKLTENAVKRPTADIATRTSTTDLMNL